MSLEEEESSLAKRNRSENANGSIDAKSFRKQPNAFNLLIASTGSVAAVKVGEIIRQVRQCCAEYSERMDVRLVVTDRAMHFIDKATLEDDLIIYDDNDEWSQWHTSKSVLHIELRRWADAMLIAPLDANTLAKIANGLCDNLLSCIVRAWDPKKPLYFCPAMNTFMLNNPLTLRQIETLKNLFGYREIPCIEKNLACGDYGMGAMASVNMIASVVQSVVRNFYAIYTG